MKVLFCHKSLYAVHAWGPRSGNLVDSGASRLSPCQMQQILFQYQAPGGGGVYLETRPIHIHQLRGSFLCSQFKMQSEIDRGSSRGRIFSKLDNVFHVSCCARIAFLKKLFISHTISLFALCVTNTNQPVEKERFDITEPRQQDLAVFVTLMDDAEKVVNVCSEGKQMNKVQNRPKVYMKDGNTY